MSSRAGARHVRWIDPAWCDCSGAARQEFGVGGQEMEVGQLLVEECFTCGATMAVTRGAEERGG